MIAPLPVPRAHPLERKPDDTQALWDKAALAALTGICANPELVCRAADDWTDLAGYCADAFMALRARRLSKEPTDD